MIQELVAKARTVRRFKEDQTVSPETLRELIDLARLSPCSANQQTLKFAPCSDPPTNELIFSHLAWAGYLPDWPGPPVGERPGGYVLVLSDERLGPAKEVDVGLALQSMVLGAASRGLGTCIVASVRRRKLHRALGLHKQLSILYVLALGTPAERVVVEPLGTDGDIRYWRDDEGVFHVPKRALQDLIVEL